jgi:hypothetical protein
MNGDHIYEGCPVCKRFASLDCELPERHSLFESCECEGYRRFIWYGTIPANRRDAEKLVSVLRKKLFELTKKPGPKPKAGADFHSIKSAMKKLPPEAGLQRLATELGVSKRKIQETLRKAGWTFTRLHAEIHQTARRIKSRITPRLRPPKLK